MRIMKWLVIICLVLGVVYLAGPAPESPKYIAQMPVVPSNPTEIENFIATGEATHKIKPDNQARIIWANDSLHQKTKYCILYLHGFSASQAEGEPVHRNIAKKFNCNLYLPRLAEHGIDTAEQLINLTADKLWESAKVSLAIASQLGDKVIVMGTSTGATLALMLAAQHPEISSLVLLSPNIAIFDPNAWLLNNHWGLQIARRVTGSDYIFSEDTRPLHKKYWNYGYRLEAAVQLQEMLETAINPEMIASIKQPTLMLYYYKDNIHQDSVVKVDAMLDMFGKLGTPPGKKKAVAIPNAGNHVIASYIKSKDTGRVEAEIESFMKDVLQIN